MVITEISNLFIFQIFIFIFLWGNLKVIFETAFRHLSFSSFILTSSNIYIQGFLTVKFCSFAFEID